MTSIIQKMAGVAKPHICRLAAALALTIGLASTGWAATATRDAININISNEGGYAITGSGSETIYTLAGDMPDNVWQNTKDGTKSHTGSGARNAYITGVTAYQASDGSAVALPNVRLSWAVEADDVGNYGNQVLEDNPVYHRAWLARANGTGGTPSILVQGIPYRKYDVIVYCSGSVDDAFDAITVNGIPYVGDASLADETKTRKATSSAETWGGRRREPSLGQTAIMLKGLENPELSLVTVGTTRSICAVQILRVMDMGLWPTSKKTISINFQSARGSSGSTPAIYGLEPVPDNAWTKDGLDAITSSGTDLTVQVKEWDGSEVQTLASVTVNEKAANAHGWSGYTYTTQNQILSDYLDDGGDRAQITVSNVPYDVYDVIVYTATDTANYQFGPVTVNDTPYRWDDELGLTVIASSADSTTATRWGATRSRLPVYGRNALRVPNQTRSNLTIVGANNANAARGCIAAIQIVEAYAGLKVYSNDSWSDGAEPTSGDATIVVDGETSLSIDGTVSLGTVTVTGNGVLTLSGTGKFSATTLHVDRDATINMNTDRLDGTTITGSGTVVYPDNAVPSGDKGFAAQGSWTGTVWLKNITTDANKPGRDFDPNAYGNLASTVRLTGIVCWLKNTADTRPEIELVDGESSSALNICNGYDTGNYYFRVLKGSGKLEGSGVTNGQGSKQKIVINSFCNFTGNIDAGKRTVVLSSATSSPPSGDEDEVVNRRGIIYVDNGFSVTIPSASVWTTGPDGALVVVNGGEVSFSNNASITNRIRGAGTVIRTGISSHGGVGSVAGLSDATWTGVFEFRNCNMGLWNAKDFGNSESTVRLNGTTSYLYTGSNKHTVKCIDIGSGGWTVDGNYSNGDFYIPAKLTGSGAFSASVTGSRTFYFTGDVSEFTGVMIGGTGSRVVIGSSTARAFAGASIVVANGGELTVAGTAQWNPTGGLFVDEGGTVTLNGAALWTAAGISVDGTIKATGRGRWGGGTTMTLNDTGVLELTSTADNEDYDNYSGVVGTGTIKYTSTNGWRLFPDADAKMPATTLTIQTELADSLIIACSNETVIGNLAGSRNIRSDWTNNGENGRTLTVTQSKDTEWQGKFVSNRITQFNVIAPVEGVAGTLTLSGTQESTIPAQINGVVNLTGTWVGATTVNGTFGGTGTLTGNLSFSNGATFKAFAVDDDVSWLSVSGTTTFPTDDGVSVAVDVSAIAESITSSGIKLLSSTGTLTVDVSKLTVTSGYFLRKQGTDLFVYPLAASVTTASGVSNFATVDAAIANARIMENASSYEYITIYQSGVVSANLANLKIKTGPSVEVTIAAATSEYAYGEGSVGADGVTTYTRANNATEYTWTDAYSATEIAGGASPTHSWGQPVNWSFGAGTVATRAPTSIDAVIFNDGATVAIAGASCASMTVNGDVSIGGSGDLDIYGNVADGGNGMLTLSGVCLNNWSASAITVSPCVAFASGSAVASHNRGAVTFNGDASVSGLFRLWDIDTCGFGTVEIEGGATLQLNQALDLSTSATTLKGNFSKTANANENTTLTLGDVDVTTSATPTISAGTISLIGAVTIQDGATFTVPASGMTVGNGASFVLAGASSSLVDNGGDAEGKVSTTVANSYVKLTGSTYSVDAYNTVTFTAPNATVTRTDALGNAIKDGDTITFTVTPDAGYNVTGVTAGGDTLVADNGIYSYTVTGDATITVATAEAASVTITPVSVTYGADFTNATITATVSGTGYDTATYSLTWGSAEPVAGVRDGSTVTFTVPVSSAPHASVSYTITATVDDSQAGSTAQSAVVADSDKWVDENSGTTRTAAAGGSWATEVTYDNNVAEISDNTFTANNCSTGDLVTVTIENVVYADLSDLDVSAIAADSQGAFAIGTVEDNNVVTTNFMVLAKENNAFTWKPATCSVAAGLNVEYDVVFTFDYAHGTYSVSINGEPLSVNNSTTFALCTAKTEVKEVEFKGTGKLSSILGVESTGYMVKDSAGNWYATIADAIANYSVANGPYFVLHAGTAPVGWKIVTADGVSILKKDVSGVMILAY